MEKTFMSPFNDSGLVTLDPEQPIWSNFFMVAPLVVIGTKELTQDYDLAPKHMAMPLGWDNYFAFVCTPKHCTYQNIQREQEFTISFPYPEQVVLASLTATPRLDDPQKPIIEALPTIKASVVDGIFLAPSYLFLECKLERIIDNFGENSLIIGKIIAAAVAKDYLRNTGEDEQDLIFHQPLLAYLPPGRYAKIEQTFSFPFPANFHC
jgi:flavin reductase (DIM6/NTAB) family NADH-FMN oxidoreductase RutF